MNIQAINYANSVMGCQPIKQVEFAKKPSKEANQESTMPDDSFVPSPTLEQKYDLACRLAAYYKTQYEQLLANGSIVA